jgi:ubiquinone/menaquinone biosynthesis C-methylase UbiE
MPTAPHDAKTRSLRVFYESNVWHFHQISDFYERIRLQNIFEFLFPAKSDIVLDAGSGGGTYAKQLATKSAVIATDISKQALLNAKESLSKSINVNYIVCANEYLPLRGQSINKIACVDVLEHSASVDGFIAEMARVLSPCGRISIFTACGNNKNTLENILKPALEKLIMFIRLKFGHTHIFSTEELEQILEPKFKIVKIQYMHHWLGWFIKFVWDISKTDSSEDCSQMPTFKNPFYFALSQALWLVLKGEYYLLKNVNTGTEINVNALRKIF